MRDPAPPASTIPFHLLDASVVMMSQLDTVYHTVRPNDMQKWRFDSIEPSD